MPTNNNYASVVTGWSAQAFYNSPDAGLAGSNDFSASVLFLKIGTVDASQQQVTETLWSNLDAASRGWAISILSNNLVIVSVRDAAPSTKTASFDLGSIGARPYLNRLILATLTVHAGNLTLAINGDVVGAPTALNVGGVLPSTAGPRVGNEFGNVNPATSCGIVGVSYSTFGFPQIVQSSVFLGSQDAYDLSAAWQDPNNAFFTNLWSAQDAGSKVNIAATPIWQPRNGAVALNRNGTPVNFSYKNLSWY